ncbi:unnamed protein product [Cercopithifilaria johnstoni]|uniref:Uncharacterized protein n=1 Tax=Cercopithifilaria johnstoni TaxID=2874296 RepID=A0A8J2Q5K5_9BILA|nr:unnamed protein product [Cercopithifilaria johnstoni]
MPNMIVPVLWIREIINIDENTKNDVEKVVLLPRWARFLGILLLGAGLLLWTIFLIISLGRIYFKRNDDDEAHLIENSGEN